MTAPCRLSLTAHLAWYSSKRNVQFTLFLISTENLTSDPESYLLSTRIRFPKVEAVQRNACPVHNTEFGYTQRKGVTGLQPVGSSSLPMQGQVAQLRSHLLQESLLKLSMEVRMALVPALEEEKGRFLWFQGQTRLHSEFQDSQGYRV